MNKQELQNEAGRLGFDLCRVAAAGPSPHARSLGQWLQEGRHATMEWMRRTESDRADPRRLLPSARSVVVLATNYFRQAPSPLPENGRIAQYARGTDYHEVIAPRLQALAAVMAVAGGEQRWFVDSGPVMERDWAAVCGVSWHGKSTMGIHPRLGTWFFLSVVLTSLELEPDPPLPDRCGRCTRCIDSCPTGAIDAPYQLDARKCISFLTIENKGPIPPEFREAVGDRIFGCDDCLEACPWNRFALESRDAQLAPSPEILRTPLREFLALGEETFKQMFRHSPILRTKRRGFLRNVCVALGNKGSGQDLPALRRAAEDDEPLVREHALWAITRILAREGANGAHQSRCSTESR